MMNTWSLAPLSNQREYSENEKIVLEYFFTNVDKNIYCATNNLSSQLWAFLVWQYSRTHLSLRDRFLQLFEDSKIALEKWQISQDEYISLDQLANSIQQNKKFDMSFFENKASDFLKKWWVDYGHNSLKDADRIRFAIEWISQVFTKIIESPFPALWDFQEKSTRYIHFGKESLIIPQEVYESSYKDEILQYNNDLMDLYLKYVPLVQERIEKYWLLKESDFSSRGVFERTLAAKSFDICRYLLPSSVATSLWATFSTRVLEMHLTHMYSHPISEVRMIAQSMHQEALKLSPWLLRHVWENEFKIKSRQKLSDFIDNFVWNNDESQVFNWIDNSKRVTIVSSADLDREVLASILFSNSRKYGFSYIKCLELVDSMSLEQKETLMASALADRWQHDRMPRSLQHRTIMVEFLVDFGAYRDIQRHRATKQLWQWVSSIHWYDYPEYLELEWFEDLKEDYDIIMQKWVVLWRKIVKENPYLLEYSCALWHLLRTTFEMDPGQLAYVIELRTTPWWHHSYRRLFIELYNRLQEIAPIFSKYIRVWDDISGSRKLQEERSEVKRKALWL